ncbi:MAG: Hsp20/alpha crystallin family protein [Eggerthellaceae bacterium]|nr:Hsp20/alpha crystallin family protein [Eggerthellaceae bacterium]
MQMIMPYRRRRYPSSLGMPMRQMMSAPLSRFDASSIMKTDIRQTDEGYELTMELPGFAKEDVTAELKDGYLIVSAETSSEEASKEPEAKAQAEDAVQEEGAEPQQAQQDHEQQTWVRRERFFGSCKRSFYLGEDINEDAISAKFENGLLNVSVPKLVQEQEPEQKKLISIQG